MLTTLEKENLTKFANQVRQDIVEMVFQAKSGHIGGSLSGVEILTILYNKCLNIPADWDKNEDFETRDRFILSKGHASPLLYSVLSQKGFFPREILSTFRKIDSQLQGHPSKGHLVGVEASTGSLGQGLSIACGMAMGLKMDKNPANIVVLLGDGEVQEGSNWEAFMQIPHRKLDNVIAIIDRNRLQIDGNTEDVMSLDNLEEKLKAFNWTVFSIDGHNFDEIYETIEKCKQTKAPCVIIANTIKGKGVSFMENNAGWHGKAPNEEQYQLAMKELKV